jgi:hypothetical protein
MPRKRCTPEEIVAQLRQVDVQVSRNPSVYFGPPPVELLLCVLPLCHGGGREFGLEARPV